MKNIFFWTLLIAASAVVSCKEYNDNTYDYDEIEQEALDKYMAKYVPNAYRQEDGYYIEPIDMSAKDGDPTNLGSGWVKYNFTSRSLDGDVCHTRTESIAIQQGTFNYYTYYAPKMRYVSDNYDDYYNEFYYDDYDDDYYSYFESSYENDAIDLAFLSTDLTIDGEVVNLYAGNTFKLYIPSALHESSVNGYGGYAGASTLDSYRPMVSEIEIVQVIQKPSANEKTMMQEFISLNSDKYNWVEVNDSSATLIYVNDSYTPETSYNFINNYNYGDLADEDISGFDELEAAMNEALIDEFGLGEEGGNVIGSENDANIWYILRTLDGFVVDTNITAIKELVYGTSSGYDLYVTYCADDDYSSYVYAWYYTIPDFKYGTWNSILTISDDAYGILGVTNYSANTEIAPYTPLLFNFYIVREYEPWE